VRRGSRKVLLGSMALAFGDAYCWLHTLIHWLSLLLQKPKKSRGWLFCSDFCSLQLLAHSIPPPAKISCITRQPGGYVLLPRVLHSCFIAFCYFHLAGSYNLCLACYEIRHNRFFAFSVRPATSEFPSPAICA
jgi:hypothetical protein